MATEEKLDDIDIKILKLLQQNSRSPSRNLQQEYTFRPRLPLNVRNDWNGKDTYSDMEPSSTITRWGTTSSCYAISD